MDMARAWFTSETQSGRAPTLGSLMSYALNTLPQIQSTNSSQTSTSTQLQNSPQLLQLLQLLSSIPAAAHGDTKEPPNPYGGIQALPNTCDGGSSLGSSNGSSMGCGGQGPQFTDHLYSGLSAAQPNKIPQQVPPGPGWSVPRRRAPVCITSARCSVCPSTDQSSLIGTLLEDAADTSVGSILPRFMYHEED